VTIAQRRARERRFKALGAAALAVVLAPVLGVIVLAADISSGTLVEILGSLFAPMAGTLEMAALGVLMAWPLGAWVGIHLSESGPTATTRWVRGAVHALSGTPSLVIGMCVHALIVLQTGTYSAIAGGLALAFVMLPTLARTTEELLRLVPMSVREASLALGIPRWRAIVMVSFATVRRGLVGAALLALARAMGDAAPLMLTAGSASHLRGPASGPMPSLPVAIFEAASASDPDARARAAALSVVLLAFVGLVGVLGRRWSAATEATS
jgi:phosphate transport system permease protein